MQQGGPVAVFTSRTNSHPFQERHITITEPVKIGRSVARVKASTSNAIFDCRVLSRNHALLWYENNKVCMLNRRLNFYLRKTFIDVITIDYTIHPVYPGMYIANVLCLFCH